MKKIINSTEIPFLQNALNASYKRSTNTKCPYNFKSILGSAAKFVNDIVILGFYFKDTPSEAKAFVTGVKHGNTVEYSTGGSLSDIRLRQFPFNHILMWQLILCSKQNGCHFLDMGGITDGTEKDNLRGISNFKRLFPGFELSTGREMEISLRPNYIFLYSMIKKILKPKVKFIKRQ